MAVGVVSYLLETPVAQEMMRGDLEGAKRAFSEVVVAAQARDAERFLEHTSAPALAQMPSDATKDAAMAMLAQMEGAEGQLQGEAAVFVVRSGADDAEHVASVTMVQENGKWRLGPFSDDMMPQEESAQAEAPSADPGFDDFAETEAIISGKADIRSGSVAELLPMNQEASDLSDLSHAKLVFGKLGGLTQALTLKLDLTKAQTHSATWGNGMLTRRVGGVLLGPADSCVVQLGVAMQPYGGTASGRILPCALAREPSVAASVPANADRLGGKFQVYYAKNQRRFDSSVVVSEVAPSAPSDDDAVVEATGSAAAGGAAAEEEIRVVLGWPRGAAAYDAAVARSDRVVVYFCSSVKPCHAFERDVLASPEVTAALGATPRVILDPDGGPDDRRAMNNVSSSARSPSVWVVQGKQLPQRVGSMESASHFASALTSALRGR